MSAPTATPIPASPSPTNDGNQSNSSGPTSSPLLFFVALGFGVVFTNLWIIVGVKYCFRYNQRNRRQQQDENGEPIDLTTMPRTHRRRREKKLMTMDEVNDRFPLTKYKNWMASREEEGLPTAGGVAAPGSPASSLRDLEGATSPNVHQHPSQDKHGNPNTPNPTVPQGKGKDEKGVIDSIDSPKASTEQATAPDPASPSKVHQDSTQTPRNTEPQPPQAPGPSPNPPPAPLTRQEVHDDNDMDDDDQIQIAVPTELLANPGDSCAICIDTLEDDDDVRGLTCGHAFHAGCLDPWLTSRRACCPLCKADYYVPKPRIEGDAAAEADRHAGRRPSGMNGARVDAGRAPRYTFMGRRDGRPRMILPGRFMAIGHLDDAQAQRYGFSTVQPRPRSGQNRGQNADEPEVQPEQPNTWRSRLVHLAIPKPTLPARFRRNNPRPNEQADVVPAVEVSATSQNPTPGQLEACHRS
ncbi:MAG: hypothetical protein Q9211_006493 [Gyalolechia sp. 1 TL-2023]